VKFSCSGRWRSGFFQVSVGVFRIHLPSPVPGLTCRRWGGRSCSNKVDDTDQAQYLNNVYLRVNKGSFWTTFFDSL
jgi:hypothetical protein